MASENTPRCIPTLKHTQKTKLFPCRGEGGCSWLQISPVVSPFCPSKPSSLFCACQKAGCSKHFPLPSGYFYSKAVPSCTRVFESVKPGCSHPCSLLFPHILPGLALGPSGATESTQEHLKGLWPGPAPDRTCQPCGPQIPQ